MRKVLLSIFTLVSFYSFGQQVTVNDENAEPRTLDASFSAIQVSDGIELFLTQGSSEQIAVSASEPQYLERLKTEVVDGVLKIYYDNKTMIWNNNEKRRLRAYVSFKDINRIKAGSGAEIKAKSVFKLDDLQLDFSSGAQFTGQLDVAKLDVDQSSGSEIIATGKAGNLKVEVSSGAIFKGYDFASDYSEAKASSGGEVRITVNKELVAKASSGGSIKYKGEAVIKDLNVSSGGSVKRS